MPLPTQPVGTLERVYTALYVLSASLHPRCCRISSL